MSYRFLIFSFSLFTIVACKTTEKSEDISELSAEMSLTKGPCFGKCPVYDLTIYKGGMAAFEGKRFVEKFGLHTKKLDKKEYRSVLQAFENADLWSMEDHYESNVSDISKTTISFTQKDNTKTITGDITRPKQLKDLEKLLVAIANSDGWTLQSIPDREYPDNFITDELMISLKDKVEVRAWMQKYADWDLELVKEIGRGRNLYLFKYDHEKFKPAQVMNTLSLDEEVKVAEFNKEVKGRN